MSGTISDSGFFLAFKMEYVVQVENVGEAADYYVLTVELPLTVDFESFESLPRGVVRCQLAHNEARCTSTSPLRPSLDEDIVKFTARTHDSYGRDDVVSNARVSSPSDNHPENDFAALILKTNLHHFRRHAAVPPH